MKIVFLGTPDFAVASLKALIENDFNVVGVVTMPDKKSGRGMKLQQSAVKKYAIQEGITILQPLNLKDESFQEELRALKPDLQIIVAFRMLPESVWQLPKYGTFNLHGSLLPNYRGAAPINWAVMNGEKETGITTFFIDKRIDSGTIILQERIKLTNKTTAAQLHNTLMNKGSKLLISTLILIKNNSINKIPQQNDQDMLVAPKLKKELLKINWTKSAKEIHNLIRGLSPFLDNNTKLKDVAICPSAWFILKNNNGIEKRIKVHLSEIISTQSDNLLSIKTDNKTYLHIITNKNTISILNLQPEGKNPMTIQQFLQGNKINRDDKII